VLKPIDCTHQQTKLGLMAGDGLARLSVYLIDGTLMLQAYFNNFRRM